MEGIPFGQYLLLDLLGRGRTGEVWCARDTVTGHIVAIKLLPKHLSRDEHLKQRFRKQALAVARLTNPHLVQIHARGEIDGRLFLETRFIEGHNLEDVIGGEPMQPRRAVHIVEQLADALQAAHGIGLIHRDIKPSNVLLTDKDFVYLTDFGLAATTGETPADSGSYQYTAPELLTGYDVGIPSDVYSLTCLLFECLTGVKPFPGDSLESQVSGHVMTAPPRPSTVHRTVPTAFDAVIATGMAKDSAARFSSVMALAGAARAAVAAHGGDA